MDSPANWIETANSLGAWWADNMWRACWQGGLAILFVWLLCRSWPALPTRVQCWLWRLAYLKLLLTLSWATPIDLPVLPPTPLSSYNIPLATIPEQTPEQDVLPIAPLSAEPNQPATVAPVVWPLLLWLCGVGCGLAGIGRAWHRTRRLHRACAPIEDAWLEGCMAELCQQFQIKRRPAVLAGDSNGPLLMGVLRPTVILPSALIAKYNRAELRLLLAHELAHLQRRDLLWAWLPATARVLFFFHPLVWLAQREWTMAHEMDCDASVLLMTGAPILDYSRTLVKVATGKGGSLGGDLLAVGVVESHQTLRRRLISMQYVQQVSQRKLVSAAIVLTGLGLTTIVPWRLVTGVADAAPETQQQPTAPAAGPASKPRPAMHEPLTGLRWLRDSVPVSVNQLKVGDLIYSIKKPKEFETVFDGRATVVVTTLSPLTLQIRIRARAKDLQPKKAGTFRHGDYALFILQNAPPGTSVGDIITIGRHIVTKTSGVEFIRRRAVPLPAKPGNPVPVPRPMGRPSVDSESSTRMLLAEMERSNPRVWQLQQAISQGADVNARSKSGFPPLHLSVWNSRRAMTLLVGAGADVNVQDRKGDTAMAVAAEYGDAETVRFLLDNGANPNIRNANGRTVLGKARYAITRPAASGSYKKIVQGMIDMLKARGAKE